MLSVRKLLLVAHWVAGVKARGKMEGACLVMDVGSGWVKAELASAEHPKAYQSVVGTVKHKPLLASAAAPAGKDALPATPGAAESPMFVGAQVKDHRGLLKLSHPIAHGHVTDWKGMTRLFHHVVQDLGFPPKEHPVLVTEAPNESRHQRAKIAQILFEDLQVPAAVFSVQALLSLYASGLTTGVVLDVGDGVTHACPVYDGYSIREATRRVDFGGRDVTEYLQLLMRQHGNYLDTSAEFDICREIKEDLCHVAESALRRDDPSLEAGTAKSKFRMPDGAEITLGAELKAAPELLFDPTLNGHECSSVVQTLVDSIRRTDVDLRTKLFESVFLAGGTTLLPKFCERFLTETAKATPWHCRVKLHAPAERQFTTWIGGSFLAHLSTFETMLTKRAEYQEQGERLIHSRIFA